MKRALYRWVASGFATLILALFLSISPAAAASPSTSAQAMTATPFQGTVVNYANVRAGPTTHDHIYGVDRPGTSVTVYAQVSGQAVWAGNIWDRISPLSSGARYIYSALVQAPSGGGGGGGGNPPPSANGKVIVVSISKEWLWAYDNGKQVYDTPVTTAMPGLVTPKGKWHIFSHLHPTTFYSPWPPGSPYYYPPTHINYAMGWHSGGYFLHDAYWRSAYGPGTNVWHYDPVDGWMTGTHGCINAPLKAIIWLYYWAPNGTELDVVN